MVRVNLISPKKLTDQHLIAEYAEILILADYIKKYPKLENIPKNFCLGEGHQRFFKNKIKYLKKRHEELKKEMRNRNFKPRTKWIYKNDPSKETIRDKKTGKVMNFTETWDDDTKIFIENLRKYILNSTWSSEKNNVTN